MLSKLQLDKQSGAAFPVDSTSHATFPSNATKQRYSELVSISQTSRLCVVQEIYKQILAVGTWDSAIFLLSFGSCGRPVWIVTLGGVSEASPFHPVIIIDHAQDHLAWARIRMGNYCGLA